jgi:hypothetical protein
MKYPAIYKAGDKVSVLIGPRWHAATVSSSFEWNDSGGNVHTSYRVRFPYGSGDMMCGPNSLRHRR